MLLYYDVEKTLESPLKIKELKPVNPKGISPEYSLEGLMLKLKLQYFGTWCKELTHWKKTMMLGKVEVSRSIQERMRWSDAKPHSMDVSLTSSGSWWWTGKPGVLQSMGLQRVGHYWVPELTDWLTDCKFHLVHWIFLYCYKVFWAGTQLNYLESIWLCWDLVHKLY